MNIENINIRIKERKRVINLYFKFGNFKFIYFLFLKIYFNLFYYSLKEFLSRIFTHNFILGTHFSETLYSCSMDIINVNVDTSIIQAVRMPGLKG